MREERRLRVFENRVMRGIFGPKREEGSGEWRKLHIWGPRGRRVQECVEDCTVRRLMICIYCLGDKKNREE